jgi:hypothetical protein
MQTRLNVIIANSGLSFFHVGVLGVFRWRRPGDGQPSASRAGLQLKVFIFVYFSYSLILHLHDADSLDYSMHAFEPKRPEVWEIVGSTEFR